MKWVREPDAAHLATIASPLRGLREAKAEDAVAGRESGALYLATIASPLRGLSEAKGEDEVEGVHPMLRIWRATLLSLFLS